MKSYQKYVFYTESMRYRFVPPYIEIPVDSKVFKSLERTSNGERWYYIALDGMYKSSDLTCLMNTTRAGIRSLIDFEFSSREVEDVAVDIITDFAETELPMFLFELNENHDYTE